VAADENITPRTPAPPPQPGAWRITFAYNEQGVELVSSEYVDMTAPAPASKPITPDQSGFWVQLHGDDDKVVYQQQLHSPIRHEHEVFSPVPGEPIRHVPRSRVEGTFDIIVPALPEAAHVTLHGSVGPEEQMRPAPARELGRYKVGQKNPEQRGKSRPRTDRGDRGEKS
jgi:hypothetical protein